MSRAAKSVTEPPGNSGMKTSRTITIIKHPLYKHSVPLLSSSLPLSFSSPLAPFWSSSRPKNGGFCRRAQGYYAFWWPEAWHLGAPEEGIDLFASGFFFLICRSGSLFLDSFLQCCTVRSSLFGILDLLICVENDLVWSHELSRFVWVIWCILHCLMSLWAFRVVLRLKRDELWGVMQMLFCLIFIFDRFLFKFGSLCGSVVYWS